MHKRDNMIKSTKGFAENGDAVSDVIGELLMTAIAVIAFAILATFILSYSGPADNLHMDISGWVDVNTDTIHFMHNGGESISFGDIQIRLNIDGVVKEFTSDNIATLGTGYWELGDIIVINTSDHWGVDITEDSSVNSLIISNSLNVIIFKSKLLGEEIAVIEMPTIALNNPAEGTVSETGDITFQYTPDDENFGIAFCELVIDGSVDQTDNNITKGTVNEFVKHGISAGTHTWCVRCTDDSPDANVGVSETRNLIVELLVAPVSLWHFNENAGSTAYDSADGNDGTIIGATWTTGVNGSALSFDGVNDYVGVSDDPSLNPGEKLTVEAWVKWGIDPSTGDPWANIVNKGSDSQYQIQHDQLNTKFEFALQTDTGRHWVQSTTMPVKDVWYYVVGTYNSTAAEIAIYVNGVEEDSVGHSGTINPTSSDVHIGRRSSGDRYFNGVIDNVAIWDRDMTPEEILERYNETKPEEGGIVSRWQLNENTGTIAYDSAGDNDGTISGATWTTGVNGSALLFDGSDDYVEIDGQIITDYPFTMSTWIKAEFAWADQVIFDGADSSFSNSYYGIYVSYGEGGRVGIGARNPATQTVFGETVVTDGEWHHVVGVFASATDRRLYVDGVSEANDTTSVSYSTDVDKWTIGRWGDSTPKSYFKGVIDEVSLYGTALSAEEVGELYNETKPKEGGVVSLWHLDEDSGATAYDSADGNDGTISGATWCAGVSESALLFNGIDDYVRVPESENLTGMDELTIEVWVNLDELGGDYRDVVGKDSQYKLRLSPSGEAYKLSGVLYLDGGYNSITADSVDNIDTTGEWYYLVFTYNGSHTGLYINGELKKTAEAEGSVQPNSNYLIIGGKPSVEHTVGGIVDEVAIYDTALSSTEIKARYDAMKPAEGSVSLWHLDENGGTIAYDSADGNDGTISGATWTTGVNGSALEFDGTDDKVEIDNADNLDLNTITVGAWIKPRNLNTFGWKTFVDKNNFINQGWTFLHAYDYYDGRWDNYLTTNINGDHVKSTQAVVEDEWQYVAFTYNSTHLNIYYNGGEVYSGEKQYDLSSIEKFVIGSGNTGNYYDGIIDEVSVYGRALTADEILECYNATKPEESTAISEWHLDENSGATTYDSADGNDGTISGATWTTGVNGPALSFDGDNDYVIVPNSENLNPADEITIEAWASTTEHDTSKVVDKGDWKGYDIALDKHKGWKGGVYIDGTKYKVEWSGGAPVLGQWYYLVLTYNGSAVTLYVDGVKEDTEPASGSLQSNSNDISIGSVGENSKFFTGTIDEVVVYGKALTPEEIQERYTNI